MTKQNEMVGEVYYPSPEIVEQAHIRDYDAVNQAALDDLPGFWGQIAAENYEWYKPWETVLDDHNAPFSHLHYKSKR